MIYLGILILNWFDEIIKRRSIVFPMLCLFYLAWLGGAADPITTTDYTNYEADYNTMYNSRFEWAYLALSKMAYMHGMTYAQFRLILVFGIFIVLLVSVTRFTKNLAFFVGAFSMFPFFNEITQIRSFAMYTLVLLASSFLIHVNKRNIIISALIIFIAAGFHNSGYFYFIFIGIRLLIDKNKKINTIIVMTSLLSFIILMVTGSTFVGQKIAQIIGKLTGNTNATENILTNFIGGSYDVNTILMVLLYTLILLLSKKMIEHLTNLVETKNNLMGKNNVLMALVYSGMLSLPLLAISEQYQRFPRFGLETAIIIAAIYFEYKIKIIDRLNGMLMTFVFIILLSIIFYRIPDSVFAKSIPFLAHLKR